MKMQNLIDERKGYEELNFTKQPLTFLASWPFLFSLCDRMGELPKISSFTLRTPREIWLLEGSCVQTNVNPSEKSNKKSQKVQYILDQQCIQTERW